MKTTILNIVIAAALTLSVSNVYADGTKGAKKDKTSNSERVLDKFENFKEADLSLESWMTEVKEFVSGEAFFEEEVNLEAWMMEEFSANTEINFESTVEIENWMTETFTIEAEEINFENEVELENWMINTESFNEKFTEEEVALQDWMLKII